MDEGLLLRMLKGIATRNYEACAETVPEAFGLSRSSVSRRYVKGTDRKLAQAAGLNPDYIARLAALPTYSPTEETLRLRASIPSPESLPAMTVEELAACDKEKTAEFAFVSVLGYVMKVPRSMFFFRSHLSRDITARASRRWRGISLDTNDDMGRPPFRLPSHMDTPEAVEFVHQWLDHYLGKSTLESVAYLAEYREQTEREATVA